MNKILLVEDINKIENGKYLIEYTKNSAINVLGTTNLSDYATNSCDLEFTLIDGANLTLDKLNFVTKDVSLIININNDGLVNLNWAIINEGRNRINLIINMNGNNSNCSARIRVINKDNNSNADVICDGIVLANTKDNVLIEDLKGLVHNDSTIKISPIMKVNTNEVMANHLVTIGAFNRDELFYLNSKGLSDESAKNILIHSFISGILNMEMKELIPMEVIKFE